MTQVDVIFHLSPSSLHQVNHVPRTAASTTVLEVVLEVVVEVDRVGVRIDKDRKDRTGQG